MVANNISKIIDPIQSGVQSSNSRPFLKKSYFSSKEDGKDEKIKADEKGLQAIRDYAEGDLRHSINILQASLGEITESNVKASAGLTKTKDVDGVLKLALDGKIAKQEKK